MDFTKTIAPIFIGKTRSFWLGIFPAVLTLIDVIVRAFTEAGQEPVAAAISAVLGQIFGWTPDQIHSAMVALAPIYALIVAQQRAGLARPYTIHPSKEAEVVQAIEDGRAAFDAGKLIGEAIGRAGGK
ncbi:hypothetical protein VB636_20970 [Paracoccus sp. APAP_BH8]|uniref:hypothetical protein n=1 Tax=Paracoccus sp. APAP_BH8 TaxID=3110237 RepID=UPI002FD7DE60